MSTDMPEVSRHRAGKFFSFVVGSKLGQQRRNVDPKFIELFAAQAEVVFALDAGPRQTYAIKKRDDVIRHLTGDERDQVRMIAASLDAICSPPRIVD